MGKEQLDRKRFGQLKRAILHGQRAVIESLLDENAPVDNSRSIQKEFRSPLHSSIYLGDLEIVRELLERGASVNAPNVNDETALILAANFKKYDIVDLLLSDKLLKNCANRENFTHLHIACMRNRVDVVEKLLEHKADVNTAVKSDAIRWSGFSPLHFAVQFKCIETVAFLLKAGADITIQESKQLTALHLADMRRNDQIIDMILEAHKKVPRNPANKEGLSHFHIACTRNNKEIVECFIKNGVALDEEVDSESSRWASYTGLDLAIYYDCIDVVRLLLEQSDREMFPVITTVGGPCDRVNNAHWTGNAELANLVLYRDKLRKDDAAQIEKPPALHYSCIYEHLVEVKRLLSQDSTSLNTPMWQGSTPLHLAVERGDEGIIRYLLNQRVDFSIRNADGKTPLHLALERNMKKIVKLFLNNSDRMKENTADNDGFSHLHIACIDDNQRALARFVKLGVDINSAVNFDSVFWPGFTPLHFAAKFGSGDVARYLLEQGASYTATNKNDQTAFDLIVLEFQDVDQENIEEVFDIMRAILLLHQTVNDDSFSDRGFSLLHILQTSSNDTESMRGLIKEHQGDINKAVNFPGSPWNGYTPLHFAMLNDEEEYANLLIEFGADISSVSANGDYPYHLALYHYSIPQVPLTNLDFEKMQHNPMGSQGNSLFHAACALGHVEWVKYFLDHGIDPNIGTNSLDHEFSGKTPLHWATSCQGGSKLEVVKLLLDHGADATLKDDHLNTPLHSMIGFVEDEVIDLLVNHGVDVNSQNASFETPLLRMCLNTFWFTDEQLSEKMKKLLDYGTDINLEDEFDRTPLTLNTWEHRLEEYPLCVEVLLKHVMKLKAMEAYVHEVINSAYFELSRLVAVPMRSNFINFPDQCAKELEVLKEVRLNFFTSLYDVLYKDLNGLSVMSENNEFLQIINSEDFEQKYPIYGPVLKQQLRSGKERRQLMSDAERSFKCLTLGLTRISVPRECSERIFQYLTNEDLKSIIMSYDQ